MFFIKGFLEILKDFVRQYAQLERNMMKSYLIQETITRFHDVIGDLDEYAPQVWKKQNYVWETNMIFIFIQSFQYL
jgi:hypothetical protein